MLRKMGVLQVALLTLATVTNTRNISAACEFGSSLGVYFVLAAFLFFLPASLIVADFSARYEEEGGIYLWVSSAFGAHWGRLAVWLQWFENIFYYPLSLLFLISSFMAIWGYEASPLWLCLGSNLLFWAMTWTSVYGLGFASAWISILTVLGLMLPIILLGFMAQSYDLGYPMWHVPMQMGDFAHPMIVALAAFLGVELNAVYVRAVARPRWAIPAGILLGACASCFFLLFGSWGMMSVLQGESVHAGNALARALQQASAMLGLGSVGSGILIASAILAPMGGVMAWILGPVQAFKAGMRDVFSASLSFWLNIQALLVTMLSLIYLMLGVQGLFWLMTDAMVGLYLGMYVLMFAAAWVQATLPGGLFAPVLVRSLALWGLLACLLGFGALLFSCKDWSSAILLLGLIFFGVYLPHRMLKVWERS